VSPVHGPLGSIEQQLGEGSSKIALDFYIKLRYLYNGMSILSLGYPNGPGIFRQQPVGG